MVCTDDYEHVDRALALLREARALLEEARARTGRAGTRR